MNLPALSPQEQSYWDRNNYLLLRGALSPQEASRLLDAVDSVLDGNPHLFSDNPGGGAVKLAQAVERIEALDFLIDHPVVFPRLLALMGPYIQIMGSEIFLRRPSSEPLPMVPWHTDGGPAMESYRPSPDSPVLQLKVQFFLTDLSRPDCGNFFAVPGSLHRKFPSRGFPDGQEPEGARQLLVQPGDVLIFPQTLWHAVSPNLHGKPRKSVTFRYGQAWCRSYDYQRLPDRALRRMTRRQRLLFGDPELLPEPYNFFYPEPGLYESVMVPPADAKSV